MEKYKISDLFKEYEKAIKSSIRKCNEIAFSLETAKPWKSKLGGCPYLVDVKDYPLDDAGQPMIFIAQINLSDLIELDNMPKDGLLQFYIHNDDCYGYNGKCYVKYVEDYTMDENKLIKDNPFEDSYKELLPFDRKGRMNFQLKEMPVSSTSDEFDKLFEGIVFNEEQKDKMYDEFDGAGCRVGGYPYFVQSDPRAKGENEILLLQLDIEDVCGIMFGDSGNCNFFISPKDLGNRDFSNVFYDWQCC